jgi:hypothetical protein
MQNDPVAIDDTGRPVRHKTVSSTGDIGANHRYPVFFGPCNVRLASLFNDSESALGRRQAVVRRHEQHSRAAIRHGPGRLAICRVATYDDSEHQVVGFENGRVVSRFVDRPVNRGVELAIQTADDPFVKNCR